MKKNKINWNTIMIKATIGCGVLFLIYNIVWFSNNQSYSKYLDSNFEVLSYSWTSYLDEHTNDNLYGVKKPGYLSFTGNLYGVSSDNSISILWWPSFMSARINEIGVNLKVGRSGYSFYVSETLEYDENKNSGYSEEEEKEIKELFERRRREVEELYNSSVTRFGLKPVESKAS